MSLSLDLFLADVPQCVHVQILELQQELALLKEEHEKALAELGHLKV